MGTQFDSGQGRWSDPTPEGQVPTCPQGWGECSGLIRSLGCGPQHSAVGCEWGLGVPGQGQPSSPAWGRPGTAPAGGTVPCLWPPSAATPERQRSHLPVARRRHAHNCKQTRPAVISGVTHGGGDQSRRSRRGVTGWRPGWAASEPGPAQTHVGGSFCVFPAAPASRAGRSQLLAGAPAAMITLAVSRQFSHYCRARDRVSQMLRGSGGRDPEGSHGDGWTSIPTSPVAAGEVPSPETLPKQEAMRC